MSNKKILIIGNSGTGKTYLSTIIGEKLFIVPYHLDTLFCMPNDLKEKHDFSNVLFKLKEIVKLTEWLIEGIYADAATFLIDYSTHLIWLDLDWDICKQNLLNRGIDNNDNFSEKELNNDFEDLLYWASTYSTRSGESSRQEHQQIYNSATCKKIQIKNLSEIQSITDKSFFL